MPLRMLPVDELVCDQPFNKHPDTDREPEFGWESLTMNKNAKIQAEQDALKKYAHEKYVAAAKQLLQSKEQTEESYLGAKAILMINGLI